MHFGCFYLYKLHAFGINFQLINSSQQTVVHQQPRPLPTMAEITSKNRPQNARAAKLEADLQVA